MTDSEGLATTGEPQYVLDANGDLVNTSRWAAMKSGMVAGDPAP